ncbi:helix-turn-helix transcriptional regulator [Pseudothauera rhizosphaerae]|uniref:Response regulator transcription factor n=1 Tax=Pseudothauera rhizosphaerae TaxID=2565932 RepID=A0A4S4A8A5_9RHOO|nr:response regulator transcription factor [Pseudothauera rhizosphaerae]THF54991.1 response regulator transcription factor [Pseudothauera rhizosphaerae]
MSRHFFIAPAASASTRWADAFPGARVLASAVQVPALQQADTVWLSSAVPDWQPRLARLAAGPAAPPVVVLALQPSQHEALLALDGGARGYCHALSAPALLREVAVVVHHGGLWIGPELMGRVLGAFRRAAPAPAAAPDLDLLSPREQEVARAVASGHSNKEIARLLGITERTVKAHLGTAFEKLGVRDRLQLALRIGG